MISLFHHQYYTLIASLPPLPRFDRAERLPINRVRLQQRLKMLQPKHAQVVERASAFLEWQHHPAKVTDADMVADYERLMTAIEGSALKAMIQFPVDVRTIMVALRRRHRGLPRPLPNEPWGVGQWVAPIRRSWEEVNFKLAPIYPWIPRARDLLEGGETLALERLLLGLLWDWMDHFAEGKEFGFEAVLAYLFKWDTIERWLSYDPGPAKARFDQLLAEVTHGHRSSFD